MSVHTIEENEAVDAQFIKLKLLEDSQKSFLSSYSATVSHAGDYWYVHYIPKQLWFRSRIWLRYDYLLPQLADPLRNWTSGESSP